MILSPSQGERAEPVVFPDVNAPGWRELAVIRAWLGERLAEASSLSSRVLGAAVRLGMASADVGYAPAAQALPLDWFSFVTAGAEGAPRIVFALPTETAAALADFLLGDSSARETSSARASRVDRAVLSAWAERAMRPLASPAAPGPWGVADQTGLPSPDAEGYIAQISVRFGACDSRGRLFIGREAADALIAEAQSDVEAGVDASVLAEAHVGIAAILGRATVSIGELRDLEPGDVLLLDDTAPRKVVLKVGGIPRLRGRAGVKAGRMAVEITTSLTGEPRSDA
jgi:flagellar motor switch/type III secretory pathway protein FliN